MDTNSGGLFAGIFETAIDAIIAIDERGTIESFNPAAERLFGYAAQEAVGLNVRILMPSPDREAHDGYLQNYRRTGKRKIIGSGREVTALRKSGETIPIHLSLSEARIAGRRVFVGMCRDITELVRARAAVEAARLRSDAVLDTAADGILTIDARGIVQSFNRAAERLFGYTKLDMIGQNVSRLMPSDVASSHDGYLEHTLRTGERKIIGIGREVVARRRDGTQFPAWLSVSHFRIENRDFFTGIVRDISDVRQKELELKDLNRQLSDRGWFSERQLELNNVTRGASSLVDACQSLIDTLAGQVDALAAVGYLAEQPACHRLIVVAGFAFPLERKLGQAVSVTDGFLGQAVRERCTSITKVAARRFTIESSFGTMTPRYLALIPVVYHDSVIGAFELAMESRPDARVVRYLETLPTLCAAILGAIRDQQRIRELLEQSRAQTEELRVQQEETAAAKEELEQQKVRLEGINAALVHARAELEEKAEALQKTGRYKSEFLANMSHELRTPLNSVLVLAQILLENREGNLSADQVESLRVIAASGTDLLELINDILDLSKVEAGKLRFAPAHVALPDLLDDLQRMFRPLMEAKNLAFSCVQHPGLPATLHTDPLRLQQVLRNLLSNANKFTERGSITLNVSLLAPAQVVRRDELRPGEAVVFEVVDTGIGIPSDKQELIFQAFHQADSTLNRRFGGTGLGLSISNGLAEHLGGELQVQSKEGEGSRFALVLPQRCQFEATPKQKREPVKSVPPDGMRDHTSPVLPRGDDSNERAPCLHTPNATDQVLESKRALIVDDDLRNVFALRALLTSVGMQVVVAESGIEAVQQFEQLDDIDCVLMDIMMPGMDGYAATRQLRKLPRGSGIPIIALTAKAMADDRRQCLEAGASDYLSKPVNNHELLDLLRIWLTH